MQTYIVTLEWKPGALIREVISELIHQYNDPTYHAEITKGTTADYITIKKL